MLQPGWRERAIRALRHDLTLLGLVALLLGVSAGAITASVLEHNASQVLAGPIDGPFEEQLAMNERPLHFEPAPPIPEPPPTHTLRGELRHGDTLAAALRREEIANGVIHRIDRGLRPLFDFRRSRPGHSFSLVQDADGELVEFRYQVSRLESFLLVRDDDGGYRAFHEEAELLPRVHRIAGVVHSSLHAAIVQLGERGQLANDFSDIFAWDIDFTRTVHPGDEFQILYERLYRNGEAGEEYVRPGRILAANYQGAAGDLSAFYFESEQGRGGYYRGDGESVEGEFLQAPLSYRQITSRYTEARRHPILKITRPHHGIDYAAPRGTPVWSVSDGQVIYRGWAGGFGNLVKVRHENGYISYYSHLKGFAKGIKVGSTVQQKQVLGYVGSTGLATGPLVCFRIAKDGKYVNPARVHGPIAAPVPRTEIARFAQERDTYLSQLRGGPLVAIEEAL